MTPTPAPSSKEEIAAVVRKRGINNRDRPESPAINKMHREIVEMVSSLPSAEATKVVALSETLRTSIHINETLQPFHEALQNRANEVFGLKGYGRLLHLGVVLLRAMLPEDRSNLLISLPKPPKTNTKGNLASIFMTRACYLDWQRLHLQMLEEFWLGVNKAELSLPSLIQCTQQLTKRFSATDLRSQYRRLAKIGG